MINLRDCLDGDQVLLCPSCGGGNLHHGTIHVYDREEDEEEGIHTRLNDGGICMDSYMRDNPSSRRDGFTVDFRCEGCDQTSIMSISQHKGVTYAEFEAKSGSSLRTTPPVNTVILDSQARG